MIYSITFTHLVEGSALFYFLSSGKKCHRLILFPTSLTKFQNA